MIYLVVVLALPWLLAAAMLVGRWFAWRRELRAWARMMHVRHERRSDS